MTAFATPTLAPAVGNQPAVAFAAQLLAHLRAQLDSARRLLSVVLEQKAAIRARDVHGVVRLAGIMRGEIGRRELIEEERARLLAMGGERLGVAPQSVTLSRLSELLDTDSATRAQTHSAELRALLEELRREHASNQALMQLELGFLDYLMRLLELDAGGGYTPRGGAVSDERPRPRGGMHVLDLRA